MKKLNYLILSLLLIAFGTCKSQSKPENSKGAIKTKINYNSLIRPNVSSWNLGDIYIDTLVYIFYDDSYDLPYAIFKNIEGDTTSLYYDAYVNDNEIQKLPPGSLFELTWKIESFFEPGEQGDTYLAESLLSYKVLEE